MRLLFGLYLIGIGAGFFIERLVAGVSKVYLFWILASTWLVAALAITRMLQARTRLAVWLRWTIASVLACVAAFCVGFVILFDPIGMRPSPLPFTEGTLDGLYIAEKVLLIVIGIYLVCTTKPNASNAALKSGNQ